VSSDDVGFTPVGQQAAYLPDVRAVWGIQFSLLMCFTYLHSGDYELLLLRSDTSKYRCAWDEPSFHANRLEVGKPL